MTSLTRRDLLLSGAGLLAVGTTYESRHLSVEGYIFQQYAHRQGKQLGEVLGEVLGMARGAGFSNIELNGEFFTADLQVQTLDLVKRNGLKMPSVYVGGAMHEKALADRTMEEALRIGKLCRPFECKAVVNNPSPLANAAPKSDGQLRIQSASLNCLGRTLAGHGFELRVHHHTPEMADNAREWRFILGSTDPQYVSLCMDLDWVHQGGQDPLALLKEGGTRVKEIHTRNARDKLWLESFADGDIDYRAVERYLASSNIKPLIVVELAYRDNTVVTRSLEEDLRVSRQYAEKIFKLKA